ncbi:hypothetical protein BDV59DRAFT_171577 [Aspergillus ambiguus]|uniref:uncharacterized protein n=1 Tax=Aspergillus ambiguus TaxID=176160 RepID=UPI003CCCF2B5
MSVLIYPSIVVVVAVVDGSVVAGRYTIVGHVPMGAWAAVFDRCRVCPPSAITKWVRSLVDDRAFLPEGYRLVVNCPCLCLVKPPSHN